MHLGQSPRLGWENVRWGERPQSDRRCCAHDRGCRCAASGSPLSGTKGHEGHGHPTPRRESRSEGRCGRRRVASRRRPTRTIRGVLDVGARILGQEIGAPVKAPHHLVDDADEGHHRRSLPPLASRTAASTMTHRPCGGDGGVLSPLRRGGPPGGAPDVGVDQWARPRRQTKAQQGAQARPTSSSMPFATEQKWAPP